MQAHHFDDPNAGHERSDANVAAVVLSGACLLALVVAAMLAAAGLMSLFGGTEGEEPARAGPQPSGTPLREPLPFEELRRRRAEQRETLNRYGWVDRQDGVVHIPIERAIDLLSERGIPGGEPMQDRKAQDGQHEQSEPTNP